jgi:hypothetical protein
VRYLGPMLVKSLEADRYARGSFQRFRPCAGGPCRWKLFFTNMGGEKTWVSRFPEGAH